MNERSLESSRRKEISLSTIRKDVAALVEEHGVQIFEKKSKKEEAKSAGKRAVVGFEEGLNLQDTKNVVTLYAGKVQGEVKIINVEDTVEGIRIRTDYTIGSDGTFNKRVLRSKLGNSLNALEPYYGLSWAREDDFKFLGYLLPKVAESLQEKGSQDYLLDALTPPARHSHQIKVKTS